MMRVKVVERFLSLQGEGLSTGLPTYFIRLSGCNLRCSWCDTPYALTGGEDVDVKDLVEEALTSGAPRVCLTGGEPLLQEGTLEIIRGLLLKGLRVEVETNGTLSLLKPLTLLEELRSPPRDLLFSMDVKCPSSGEEGKTFWKNMQLLREHDQVKFVIANEEDFRYAKRVLEEHPTSAEVIFTPVWGADTKALAELFLRETKAGDSPLPRGRTRFLLQTHKYIWGEGRAEGLR